MAKRINPRTGQLEEVELQPTPQPPQPTPQPPQPTPQPPQPQGNSPWLGGNPLKPSNWTYNNPDLGIKDGVLNPNDMTKTPIPADAPYQIPQTQLSFTQRHPLLNALGGAAAGFISNAAKPGSSWTSALLSAGGGAAKNMITRNDEITKLRNDMLTKLQENRIKNNQALQLGQTAKDIGIPGYETGGYYLGSQGDLTSQVNILQQGGKPNADGNFSVAPSQNNPYRIEQINKANAEAEDIRNQLIPLMSQPETPQIKATKDVLLQKINKLNRLTGKGSVSLEDIQKYLKSQAETTKSQTEAKYADRKEEEMSKSRQQNLEQGKVSMTNTQANTQQTSLKTQQEKTIQDALQPNATKEQLEKAAALYQLKNSGNMMYDDKLQNPFRRRIEAMMPAEKPKPTIKSIGKYGLEY